jgi:hypothetical protein
VEYGISEIILKPDTVEDLGHVLDRIFREAGKSKAFTADLRG